MKNKNYDIVIGDIVTVTALADSPVVGTLVELNEGSFTILDIDEDEVHVVMDQLVMSKELNNES